MTAVSRVERQGSVYRLLYLIKWAINVHSQLSIMKNMGEIAKSSLDLRANQTG